MQPTRRRELKTWDGVVEIPVRGRSVKPRTTGFTMVLDSGLGIRATTDMAELGGEYIDNVQFTFGTSAFCDREAIREKIAILRRAGIGVTPGGAFAQVAIWQGVYGKFLQHAHDLGFTTIEVFDALRHMDPKTRVHTIKTALESGFQVVSEVLWEEPLSGSSLAHLHKQIADDLRSGVFKVIVPVEASEVERVLAGGADPDSLIWECPAIDAERHLTALILQLGPNVNLILRDPSQVIVLETLRGGLKGAPMKRAYETNPKWSEPESTQGFAGGEVAHEAGR
jgi:phosphosulfolactate synthase